VGPINETVFTACGGGFTMTIIVFIEFKELLIQFIRIFL